MHMFRTLKYFRVTANFMLFLKKRKEKVKRSQKYFIKRHNFKEPQKNN